MSSIATTVLLMSIVLLAGCDSGVTSNSEKASAPVAVIEKSAEKGPVKLTVRFSPKEPRLSDLIDLDVVVQAPLDVEVKQPPFGKSVGEFLINDYIERPATTENNLRTRTFHYKLEPVRSGQHLVRSIGVEFIDKRKGADATAEPAFVEAEPIDVTVTSELGQEAPNLANLAQMNAPRPLPGSLVSPLILGLASAVIVGIVAFIIYRRRRAASPAALAIRRSPEEIAKLELEALLRENLPAQGLFKEFYVRITGIVRRYIEQTTGIRAPEQTTEEFLRDVHFRKVFDVERAERLAQFLEAADMVKYAGLQPGMRQIEEAIARAQEFVGLSSALAPLPEKAAAG